jgi:pyrimidine-specific ribonucleoside hydrolase
MRMKKGLLVLVVLLMLSSGASWAHLERTPVIIDTDMALDDVRALVLLLSSTHVDVRAIVTSDGGLAPQLGCENVRRVISLLRRNDMPIGKGKPLNGPAPPWRELAESIDWTKGPNSGQQKLETKDATVPGSTDSATSSASDGENCSADAVAVILETLAAAEQGLSYVCLGPLTNLAEALQTDPSLRHRIETIFYYGTPPEDASPDWNTSRDPNAAQIVFTSGIPMYVFSPADEQLVSFDTSFVENIELVDSPVADTILFVHRSEKISKLLAQGHFKAWDETIALYLDNPDLGTFTRQDPESSVFRLTHWEQNGARQHYLAMLNRTSAWELDARAPVVLAAYPTHPAQFQSDLQPWVPKIIALHGIEEWKAAVLTNELHRHLGIYSILGAKMGILAREILHASLDELEVESHAGLKPPLSCLNDGLQVATGASVGRGAITVLNDGTAAPEAVFTNGKQKIRLSLRKEVRERIKSDIGRAIELYGNLTPEYFKEVRRLSFVYWTDMRRDEIFERSGR